MTKRTEMEPVIVEVEGKSFEGYRIIEGTRKLSQTIYYETLSQYDPHTYKSHEDNYMENMARVILSELVARSKK